MLYQRAFPQFGMLFSVKCDTYRQSAREMRRDGTTFVALVSVALSRRFVVADLGTKTASHFKRRL